MLHKQAEVAQPSCGRIAGRTSPDHSSLCARNWWRVRGPVVRISVVVGGLDGSTWRLQPWRYLWEVANELAARGHDVEVLSEGASTLSPHAVGLRCVDVASVNPAGESRDPTVYLRAHRPDVVLWNVGATSALRLQPPNLADTRNVAIFTSPLYRASELLRVRGVLLRQPRSHAAHVLGALVSPKRIARYLGTTYDRVVFPGRSVGATLIRAGLSAEIAAIVPPGRDSDIQPAPRETGGAHDRVTFLYAGSPAPIRGAGLLLRAFALIGTAAPQARLVILSRHERPELARQTDDLRVLVRRLGLDGRVDLVAGTLPRPAFLDQPGPGGRHRPALPARAIRGPTRSPRGRGRREAAHRIGVPGDL